MRISVRCDIGWSQVIGTVGDMTETDGTEVIAEAVALIDRGLADIKHRELLSSSEVADLLLDVRILLSMPTVDVVGPLEEKSLDDDSGTAVSLATTN